MSSNERSLIKSKCIEGLRVMAVLLFALLCTTRTWAQLSILPDSPSLPNATRGVQYTSPTISAQYSSPNTLSVSADLRLRALVISTTGDSELGVSFSASGAPGGLGVPTDPQADAAAELSGVPSEAGSFSVTIGARCCGDYIGSRTYSLVVETTLAPAALPVGAVGVSYSQALSALGCKACGYSVESGKLPAGVALDPVSGRLSGTPAPNAQGTYNFGVVARHNQAQIASGNYALTISSAPLPRDATLAGGTVGAPYSQAIPVTGGTAPFSYAVTSGALPPGLSLDAASGVIFGTPTAAANVSFTITVIDAAQSTGSRTYSIAIARQSGTLQVVSGDRQVVPANARTPVDLVARVVNGQGSPVAGAEVAWTVVEGGGSIASATLASDAQGLVRASYTTGANAADNLVRVTASGSGSSFTFVVRNQQKAVVEPARQLITPQARMALAAPSIQLNNIRQRLDQLRLIRSPAVLERLRVSVDGKALPPLSAFSLASDKDGKPQKGGGASADAPDAFEHWGVFVNGDVNLGKQSAFDTQTGFELRTKGLTLGTDYRFIGNHILGAAVGLMRADTELEGAVGTQDADGRSLSFFGSFVPRENAYVDGILTFGRNDYDSERRASTGTLNSVTQGNQWGMAVSAGYAINRGPLAMTPFGRIEHIDARVDAFSETGSGDDALSISEQRIKQTTLALGANASYAISTSWGVLAPTARMEFVRIASSSSDEVIARLAGDTIGLPAQLRLPSDDKSFGSFAIGVTGVFSKGVSGYLNYERQFSRQTYHDERFGVGIRAAF